MIHSNVKSRTGKVKNLSHPKSHIPKYWSDDGQKLRTSLIFGCVVMFALLLLQTMLAQAKTGKTISIDSLKALAAPGSNLGVESIANTATKPKAQIKITPSSISLCEGESMPVKITVVNATRAGQISKGPIHFQFFNPPGGEWKDTITSNEIGKTIEYKVTLVNPPGANVSAGSAKVRVIQKRKCFDAKITATPASVSLCPGETSQTKVAVFNATHPGIISKYGSVYQVFNPPGGEWTDTVTSSDIGKTIEYKVALTTNPLKPNVSVASAKVRVTQKRKCFDAKITTTPSRLELCPQDTATVKITVSRATHSGYVDVITNNPSRGPQAPQIGTFEAPGGTFDSQPITAQDIGKTLIYQTYLVIPGNYEPNTPGSAGIVKGGFARLQVSAKRSCSTPANTASLTLTATPSPFLVCPTSPQQASYYRVEIKVSNVRPKDFEGYVKKEGNAGNAFIQYFGGGGGSWNDILGSKNIGQTITYQAYRQIKTNQDGSDDGTTIKVGSPAVVQILQDPACSER